MAEYSFVVDLDNFQQHVLDASRYTPVMVDFWAAWCSPCLVIAPLLEKLVEEYAGKVLLAKLEVDDGENMKLAGRYKVRGFPTIILFKNGEAVGQFSGARPASFIEDFLDQHLD